MKFNNIEDFLVFLECNTTVEAIDNCKNEIVELIPEVSIMFNYNQQHLAHVYDLWFHSLHTVINLPKGKDPILYLAALLHDIGKPECQAKGIRSSDLNMHYPNHAKKSMEIVRGEVIPNLQKKGYKISNDDIQRLFYYIEYHDCLVMCNESTIISHLQKGISFSTFQNLMELEVADGKAHKLIPVVMKRIDICGKLAGTEGLQLYNIIVNKQNLEIY